jgi:hypothetical protein
MSSAMEDHLRTMSLAALAERCLCEINAARRGETHDDQCWVEVLRRATVQRDEAACEVIEYLWWLHGISAEIFAVLPLQLRCSLTTAIQIESR